MHAWATEQGLVTKWATGDVPGLHVGVRYGAGHTPATITVSDESVISVVYGIDELPEHDLRPLVLGLIGQLNLRLTMSKFGADLETGDIRCIVVLPRLSSAPDVELFEVLVAETEYGLRVWLDASKELMATL
jgi:hypothetical protein